MNYRAQDSETVKISDKNWMVTLLLCLLFWGLHRIYVGRTKDGLIFMFTIGGLVIGQFMDLIKILKGEFTDKDGAYVVRK